MMKLYRFYGILAVLCLAAFTAPAHAVTVDLPIFTKYPKVNSKNWYISNGWTNGDIQACEWRADAVGAKDGNLLLTLSDKGGKIRPYGCGEVQSKQLFGFGTYQVRMRSAAGSGVNSAFFTYVGPPVGAARHDEIDFEFLGKNPRTVQLNYFVNGKAQGGQIIKLGFDASAEFHTYSFVWEPTRIRWYIDGRIVHETKKGAVMPTLPGRMYMTVWSGTKKVDAWLGPFKYAKPITAEFAWVKYKPLK